MNFLATFYLEYLTVKSKLGRFFPIKYLIKMIALVVIFSILGFILGGYLRLILTKNTQPVQNKSVSAQPVVTTNQPEASSSIFTLMDDTAVMPRPLGVDARSFLVYDLKNERILLSGEPSLALPPASITKLLTALVVIDNLSLEETLSMPASCTWISGSKLGIRSGEIWTVEEMLQAMLIASAADATCALSTKLGGGEVMVDAINLKALALGMRNTNLTNTVGFDDTGHLSTAEDLVLLGLRVIKNPIITGIVKIPFIKIRSYSVTSTNELLGKVPGYTGIKTGHTQLAGDCLLFSYSKGDYNLIGVVMGSSARFRDTQLLVDAIISRDNLAR